MAGDFDCVDFLAKEFSVVDLCALKKVQLFALASHVKLDVDPVLRKHEIIKALAKHFKLPYSDDSSEESHALELARIRLEEKRLDREIELEKLKLKHEEEKEKRRLD